jgi:hypothetical protein
MYGKHNCEFWDLYISNMKCIVRLVHVRSTIENVVKLRRHFLLYDFYEYASETVMHQLYSLD